MSKVMYQANWFSKKINKVDVERETAAFVMLAGRKFKQQKLTENEAIYESFNDAKDWLKSKLIDDINSLESRLEYKKEELAKVNLLTE